jgi:hypothetical protein
VLALVFTGGWLLLGREGQPSPLSRLAGVPDTRLHVWLGWAFVGLVALGAEADRSAGLAQLDLVPPSQIGLAR